MGRKLIDMAGVKVGRLTVLDYAGDGWWNCQCECGNTVKRKGMQLKRGGKSSCGCWIGDIARENGRTTKKALIGLRVGHIKVLKCVDDTVGKEIYECQCDCGNIINVERRYLVDGSKTHCGCGNRVDMTGMKVGRVTVIGFAGIGKHGTALWNCKCDCGNEKVIDGALLRNGMSVSCGCLKRDIQSETHKKYNEYSVDGDIVRVRLSNSDKEMLCDVDDWEELKQYCWHLGAGGYAKTNVTDNDTIRNMFHENVIECADGLMRDHINRNRLDNRRENLRAVLPVINVRNCGLSKNSSTGYKGVTMSRSRKKYVAQIMVNYKHIHLGSFDTAEEAYKARLRAEEKYYGEVYSPT